MQELFAFVIAAFWFGFMVGAVGMLVRGQRLLQEVRYRASEDRLSLVAEINDLREQIAALGSGKSKHQETRIIIREK